MSNAGEVKKKLQGTRDTLTFGDGRVRCDYRIEQLITILPGSRFVFSAGN